VKKKKGSAKFANDVSAVYRAGKGKELHQVHAFVSKVSQLMLTEKEPMISVIALMTLLDTLEQLATADGKHLSKVIQSWHQRAATGNRSFEMSNN
jgi:hypothetical protein